MSSCVYADDGLQLIGIKARLQLSNKDVGVSENQVHKIDLILR